MFFRKKSAPTQEIETPECSSSTELDAAKDTLATALRTLAEFALPTIAFPLDEFMKDCEQLALGVLIKANVERDGATVDPVRVYREVRQLVRQQRKAEAKEYSAHRESAHIIVADLVTNLRNALMEREEHDSEIVDLLGEMEHVVSAGDLDSIRRVASKTATRIRDVIDTQQSQDQERLKSLAVQLQTMRDELHEAQSQMNRDPLTELLNRGFFDKALKDNVQFCNVSGTALTLYMLDIDLFKDVNDTYGHPIGDEVLKRVSRELVKSFPRKDDVVARYGGEEFAALCRTVTHGDAMKLGERARTAVEELKIDVGETTLSLTISIGYAVLLHNESEEHLLKRADEALYEAKRSGRNRIVAAKGRQGIVAI
ncbi:MAG: diguanylate cyclase [Deltaproteobacteria bacterium]|nr:diguanylate cyclase [Deltaproteobacteria bacterium]